MTLLVSILFVCVVALNIQNFFQHKTIGHLQESIGHIIQFQEDQMKINKALRR